MKIIQVSQQLNRTSICDMKYDSDHTSHFYVELHSECDFGQDLALEGNLGLLFGQKMALWRFFKAVEGFLSMPWTLLRWAV